MLNFDCVIIGSGVAGMTAAIYLRRANLNVALIERDAPGGQMNKISNIENYPGFRSIDGPTLSLNMYKQVMDLGVNYRYGNVIDIKDLGEYKVVKTDVEEIKCKAVIIASGRAPRRLGLENEEKLIGHGISFCALCDGFFYKDKTVAVIGGGNSAIEEAIYLANICKEVIIVHRRNQLSADQKAQEELKKHNNIKILYNSVVETLIIESDELKAIKVKTDGQEHEIDVDGMFLYIGNVPDLSFLSNLGINIENNHIVVDENMRTNIKNIYACGDVIKKEIYQITTAVAEGTVAAISAKKDIS